MGIGDWHQLNGYRFRETLHGPMVMGTCIDCGQPALEVLPTGRINTHGLEEDTGGTADTRCSTCGRNHHDARLDYYRTGRADIYKTAHVNPARLDPRHGGTTSTEGFFWRALHPNDPRTDCVVCSLPIDPAAATVEHPDKHPSCDTYFEDAPMETPL